MLDPHDQGLLEPTRCVLSLCHHSDPFFLPKAPELLADVAALGERAGLAAHFSTVSGDRPLVVQFAANQAAHPLVRDKP
jgi:hypothetical protein